MAKYRVALYLVGTTELFLDVDADSEDEAVEVAYEQAIDDARYLDWEIDIQDSAVEKELDEEDE